MLIEIKFTELRQSYPVKESFQIFHEIYVEAEFMPIIAENVSNLEHLVWEGGRNLVDMLPPLLSELRNLKELNLRRCKDLNGFRDSVGQLTQIFYVGNPQL